MSIFTSPINVLLVAVILASFIFIRRLLKGKPRGPIEIYFALVVLSGVFWKIGIVGYRTASSVASITFFTHLSFFAPVLLVLFEYFFAYYFPYRFFKLSRFRLILLLCFVGSILVITIIPDAIVPRTLIPANRFESMPRSVGQSIYGFYFGLMTFLIFKTLLVKHKHSYGILRTKVRQVLIGNGMGTFGGFCFGFIIPQFYNRSLEWIGALFSFCALVYLWYNFFWKTNRRQKQDSSGDY